MFRKLCKSFFIGNPRKRMVGKRKLLFLRMNKSISVHSVSFQAGVMSVQRTNRNVLRGFLKKKSMAELFGE